MRVLLAGGAGYLGRRLAERLIDDPAVHLRILVADARKLSGPIRARAEIVEGDPLDTDVLGQAMESIDVAYYPLRYFGIGRGFEMLSRTFTARFIEAAAKSGVRRIVYMGVAAGGDTTSNTLRSMAGAGEMLSAHHGKMEIVQLRTGAVVGSGGVFFEVPRSLVRNSPFILAPRWMEARLHIISVNDALECLASAKDVNMGGNSVMDIGGEEVSFKEMITATAEEMGLKRPLIGLPVTVPRLSALCLMLLTPLSYPLARAVVDILRMSRRRGQATGAEGASEGLCVASGSFRAAVVEALQETEGGNIVSRWTDSLADLSYTFSEEEIAHSLYRDTKSIDFGNLAPHVIFRAVKSIGGKRGWFSFDILWQIRGLMDKLMGGFGTSVGRRVESDLRVGDMLDVWRVVDVVEDRRLLLEAQMVVFGKAWLEYRIEGSTLIQTAYHAPRGIMGRLYWYSMLPFHAFIFRDMIEGVVKRAREMG